MTREELLKVGKPILFNTPMVQAILDGRKTCTRRIVKTHIGNSFDCNGHEFIYDGSTGFYCSKCGYGVSFPYMKYPVGTSFIRPNYKVGDILYVRETWTVEGVESEGDRWIACIGYKAEGNTQLGYQTKMEIAENEVEKYEEYLYGEAEFKPSIHMPKKAARIFLEVTDVRVERLLDMSIEDMIREGVKVGDITTNRGIIGYRVTNRFQELWDSTIKKKELDRYGLEANPWVWVIEFERVKIK